MTELFQLLKSDPLVFTIVCGLLGLVVGSFLNVVIHRLPKMMERDWHAQCAELNGQTPEPAPRYNLMVPRSACPHCGHAISAAENIPVLSYLFLRGKCTGCGAAISPRYPIVEAISGILSAYAAWHFGFGLAGLAAIVFVWALIALTFIDFDTQLLPDDITLPLLWLGLLLNLNGAFTSLPNAVIGAVAGYLVLWSVYWLFKLATGKEGMGYGDFKLLAAIGAWLGWQMLPLVILLSSLVGAVVGIALIVFAKHGRQHPHSLRPLPCRRRPDRAVLGTDADAKLSAASGSVNYLVGLTGGIGSGKSTVADMFAALGVRIIDTDLISHQLTQAGGAAIPAIRDAFGAHLIDAQGALDRSKMRELVFGNTCRKEAPGSHPASAHLRANQAAGNLPHRCALHADRRALAVRKRALRRLAASRDHRGLPGRSPDRAHHAAQQPG